MSENTYGMIYFIQPGDTPEYLEELRSRGFFTVQITINEEYAKECENTVITAASFDVTEKIADITTDPSYNLEYNSDPKDTTITLPTGRVVKLSDDILLTPSLSDEQLDLSQPYLYRISDYINPETGRLEDLPIPLIAFKNDDSADITVTQSPADKIYADPGLLRLCGPQPQIITIDPEYAKQMEDQFKNAKFRQSGYGRGQAFFRFIYDSDEAITPSGYELVRTESWSGPDCTDEQIADIARYIINNDFYDEQQKALMLEAVDAFLAKEEKITVADGTPNYTPVSTFSQITVPDEKDVKTADTTVTDTTDTTVTDYHYGQDNWSIGENGELIYKDTTKYIKFTSADLPFCLSLIDNRGRMMGDMDPPGQESTPPDVTLEDLTPVLIPVSSDLLQKFEEAKSLRQRLSERSNPIAFVSTMDAETEAVQSVQVACAEDGGWRTIGTLNPGGIDWKYQAGNLTGSGTASVVWHAQELGALGVWTDGTDNWTAIDGWFDGNWTMLGCGDFDGDGKDSVLMSYGGFLYAAGIDAPLANLGGLSWAGWEFGAIGDFAGDGKDDVVLFHKELGCVVLLADGNTADYTSIGQLDTSDWSIAGAGDFDGDGKDDLLVRQTSTGIAGAYASADMSKWSTVTTDYLLA